MQQPVTKKPVKKNWVRRVTIYCTLFLFPILYAGNASANVYVTTTFTDPVFTAVNNATGAITAGAGIGLVSLRSALKAADNLGGTHTITLGTGTYLLDGSTSYTIPSLGTFSGRTIYIGNTAQNITINGNGPANTIISMAASGRDRIMSANYDGVVPNVITTINGVKFLNGYLTKDEYGGAAIYAGPVGGLDETLALNNCAFENNICPAGFTPGNGGSGGAIYMFQETLTIDNCTFTNNSVVDGVGGAIVYILYNNQGNNGDVDITNSTFTGNTAKSLGGAIHITSQGAQPVGTTFTVDITKNTFLNNSTTVGAGGGMALNNGANLSTMQVHFNRFSGNSSFSPATSSGLHFIESAGSVNAENNWWGCNTNPVNAVSTAPCNQAGGDAAGGGSLDASPWLQLKTSASPNPICNTPAGLGNTSLVTTSFLTNSDNGAIAVSNLTRLIGLPVVWTSTLGTLSGQQLTIQASGTATATFTSNGTGGNATVNTQVDNVPVTDPTARATIVVNTIPIVTDPVNFTSCVGSTATFTSTITGTPTPTITWYKGGVPIVNGPTGTGATYSGATTNTLTITNVQPGDAGNYNVDAVNQCGTDVSATATLFVNQVTGGTVGSDQTVCSDPAAFTESVASTGSGTLTYQWQSGTGGCAGAFSNIVGATATTYDAPSGLTQTTYYRRVTTSTLNGVPCTANSNCITVTFNGVTGGTVGSDQTICSGGDPSAFTQSVASTGSGALTYQWQSGTAGCAGAFSDIAGATASTYDPPAGLAVTTYYRRVTTSTLNAVLCTANSNCITVTINNVTGGTVGSDQTICSGGDPAAFSQSVASTGSGGLTYQWQSNTTGCAAAFSNIVGATAITYDPPAGLSQTTYYRRVAISTLSGVPCTANSNCITVTVNSVTGGVVVANQTICSGGDPAAFTESVGATGSGTLTYQWQSNTTSCAGAFSDIIGATGATYDPPAGLAVTTFYRRIATSTLNAVPCTAISTCISVTVNNVTGGTVGSDQSFCVSGDPAAFTQSVASTGNGALTYQWQSSTTSCVAGFSDIGGATAITYDPPAGLAATTYYRRVTTSTLSGVPCTANSNCITVTVNPNNTITLTSAPGTDAQTVPINTPITNITYATTGATGATFSGLPTGVTGNWAANVVTISGTPTVGGLFNYTVTLTGGCGGGSANGSINVTTCAATLSSAPGTNNQSVCINTPITNITYNTVTATGATFSGLPTGVTGNWAANVITISGTPSVAGVFNYTITLTGAGCAGATASGTIASNDVTGGTVGSDQTICSGGDPAAFTQLVASTGTGALSYQWQSNTTSCAAAFSNIVGATASTYDPPAGLAVTTYYRRVTTSTLNGGSCTANSNCITVTVNSVTGGTVGADQTICSGGDPAAFTESVASTGSGALTYQWQSNTTSCAAAFSNIVGATAATYDPPAGLAVTTYYRRVTTSSLNAVLCTANSNCITVTINNVTGGTIGSDHSVCPGGDPAAFTQSVASTGTGALTYQWQSNTTSCAAAFSNIVGATAITYDPPAGLATTTYYRRVTTSTLNAVLCTANSNCITVTVNPINTITLTSAPGTDNQTVLIGTPITPITYATTGATGATFSGLPTGVNGNWAANVVTISGTPTVPGTFNYTVTLTGGCGVVTANGTINVVVCSITLTSAPGTNNQSVCINTPITNITYATVSATGATFSGLPPGVTGNWAASTVTISGTPTVAGTYNYTVTPTGGGCNGAVTATGTITVNPIPDAVATPSSQTACSGTPITTIVLTGAVPATTYNWTRDNTGTVTGIAASGSGNISGTLTNTTTAPVTVTFTITPTANGCPGPSTTATVLVNPTPNAVATPASQTICSGATITTIVLNSAVSGTTYTWTRDNTVAVTGIAASGSGNISGALTNTTAAPVIVTFTITPSANGCPGPTTTATVVVNPSPTVNPVAPIIVCNNGIVPTIPFSGPTSGTVFNWTNTAPSIGIGANGTGSILSFTATNTGTAPVIGTVTVTPTYDQVINGSLAAGDATMTNRLLRDGVPSVCGSLKPFPGTFGPGTFFYDTYTLTNTTGSTQCVRVNYVSNGAGDVFVAAYSNSFNPASLATNYLADGSASLGHFGLAFNMASGSTVVLVAMAVNSAQSTPSYTIGVTGLGITCSGPPTSFTITVNPTPDAVATPSSQTTCSGQTITPIVLSSAVSGTTYTWTRDNVATVTGIAASGSGNISGALTNTTASPVTVTFTITPSANGCPGLPITATVLVNPTPDATATPASQTVCSNVPITTIVITGTVPGTIFNWTRDNVATVTGIAASGSGNISGTLTNTTNAPVTVTFTITPTANGCTPGAPVTATVLVNPIATVNAVANQARCHNTATAAVNFSSPTTGGTIVYNWTNDNTSIGLAASGTGNIPSFTATNPGTAPVIATITVTPTYTNGISCTGTPMIFTITVNPIPNAVATPSSQTVCSATPITTIVLSGNVSGTTYTWTRNNTVNVTGIAASGSGNISGTLTNTTNTIQTVTFTITPSANGCTGPTTTATVTVNPTPTVSPQGNMQVIITGNGNWADEITWTLTNAANTVVLSGGPYGFNPPPTPSALVTSAGGPFTFFIEANGTFNDNSVLWEVRCGGAVVASGCIRGFNSPAVCPNTGTLTVPGINGCGSNLGAQTICSGTAITPIVLTGPVAGTVFNWTRDNNVNVTGIAASGSGNISGTLTNITNTPQNVVFTITPTANGCSGPPVTVTITVNPTPNAVATPGSQTICSGTAITPIVMSGNVAGTTYAWTRNNTANLTGIAAAGSGNVSGTLTNTTVTLQTTTFTITPTANGCVGPATTATVSVQAPLTIVCPANITVNAAPGTCFATVTYAATVTGTPAPTVTYVPASGSSFPIGTTTVTVTATNICGTVSCTFTVTVLDVQIPVITPLTNQTVCVGSSATFTAVSTFASSYQWQTWNGSAWVNIAGATSSSYTINNVTHAMNTNSFRVRVTGPCGTVTTSNHAILYVNPLPVVTLTISNPPLVNPVQTVTLTATGTPAGGTFVWFKNNVVIPGASGNTLGPLGVLDVGTYKVTYTDPNGCVNTSNEVVVAAVPSTEVFIYPNPNTGQFHIQFFNQSNEVATVTVYNYLGAIVYQQKHTTGPLQYAVIDVDLGQRLAIGTYIVDVRNAQNQRIGTKMISVGRQ